MNFVVRKNNGRPIHWRQKVSSRTIYRPGGIKVVMEGGKMEIGKNPSDGVSVTVKYPCGHEERMSFDEYRKNGIPSAPAAK